MPGEVSRGAEAEGSYELNKFLLAEYVCFKIELLNLRYCVKLHENNHKIKVHMKKPMSH